jgi:hypothetical protein
MPLQNRVDPFGAIHANPARGLFTGNRGIIHDPATKTLLKKRWTNPAWIICVLKLPGREPRDPMGYNRLAGTAAGWTELFFLDEVTALAAGHRPCFYCRREEAKTFLGCYADAFRMTKPKATELDSKLHGERRASRRKPLPSISGAEVAKLPDGAMIASGETAYAIKDGEALPWSFAGYGAPVSVAAIVNPVLLTPPTTVAVLRADYKPAWRPTAG